MLPVAIKTPYQAGKNSKVASFFIRLTWLYLALMLVQFTTSPALAQRRPAGKPQTQSSGPRPYPEFRSRFGVSRWLSDQMPLKVFVSRGLSLDSIMDPQLGAPVANVDNLAAWPNLVAQIVENPQQWNSLGVAEGYVDGHYQAALEGVSAWKAFEPEGFLSYQITDDPQEADIYVFFTKQFVNKLGMALFANDIRGYTSKTNFPYKAILAGGQAAFKPVVIVLRTTEARGASMPLGKMKAAATHEFGHALGIEGHSTNAADLMSVYYGRGVISPNDAATLRYLYRLQPDLIP